MKKPRILMLITRSEPGGAQSHVLELLKGFQYKYELIFATGENGFLLDEAKKLGIPSFLLPSLKRKINLLQDIKAYKEIRDLISRTLPDLVHSHSSKAGILGRLAAHRAGIKNIFTAHGWAFADGTPPSRKLISIPPEYFAAKWCDRIINVSLSDQELAIQHKIYTSGDSTVIHNGIEDIDEKNRAIHINETPIITMVARVAPPKNFISLIYALAPIKESYQLRIVGDGPQFDKLVKHASNAGIADKIDFMGSRDDVIDILSTSDIFVLASDWEGFPISILEAMRAGLPIIASDVGGISEAVIDGRNGYLVPRHDSAALGSAIKKLLIDKKKRMEMGRVSRSLFIKNGTTDVMLGKLEEVYNSVLHKIEQAKLINR